MNASYEWDSKYDGKEFHFEVCDITAGDLGVYRSEKSPAEKPINERLALHHTERTKLMAYLFGYLDMHKQPSAFSTRKGFEDLLENVGKEYPISVSELQTLPEYKRKNNNLSSIFMSFGHPEFSKSLHFSGLCGNYELNMNSPKEIVFERFNRGGKIIANDRFTLPSLEIDSLIKGLYFQAAQISCVVLEMLEAPARYRFSPDFDKRGDFLKLS